MAIQGITTLLPVIYLLLAFLHGMTFGGPRAPRPQGLYRGCLLLLVLLHGTWVALQWHRLGHIPAMDWATVTSLLAFSLVLIFHGVARTVEGNSVGLFVCLFAFLMQLCASALGQHDAHRSAFAESPFFATHVATAILAAASLLLSGFFGGLYLLLLGRIRKKLFGALFRGLPDLDTLARWNRRAALVGFVFMTLGLNLGIWWAHSGAVERMDYLSPKVWPFILLWVVSGLIAASRWLPFLSSRRASWLSLVASSALLFALVVAFVPVGLIHKS